jgi:putative peptidoglycan lipid II flippase
LKQVADTTAKEGASPKLPNVAKAGGIMMASLFLSRILGLVRDAVIAGKFGGASIAYVDAYRLAFSVPDLLFFLIAGGALSSAFIPVFSEYLHTDREDEAWHVFSVVTTIMSIIVVAFIVLAWVYAEPLVHLVAQGKTQTDPAIVPFIVYMSRIVLPTQFAFFIGGLMFGTLYARQIFTVPGLGPNIYNIGIIFGALFLSALYMVPGAPPGHGVAGMSWGALIGAMLGNLLIPWLAMRKIGMKFTPSLDWKHPGVKKVFKLMLPVVLGLSLPGVYALIMQYFGAFFHVGVNAYLEFSNKLMQAPLGIFGQSLAIGVFPALAQFFAQKRLDMYRSQLSSTIRTVIYLTIPTTVLMAVMAPQIVSALLKAGQFTAHDAEQTAMALRWFCIGITPWCLHPVLMRGFFAAQETVTPILLGTLTTGVFVALILSLWKTSLGFLSLPLAGSISAVFLVLVLSVAVAKRIGGLDYAGIWTTLWKSLAASVAVALVAGAVTFTPIANIVDRSKLLTIATVGVAFLVAAWGYYLFGKWLGMPETAYVTRAMERINRRGARS